MFSLTKEDPLDPKFPGLLRKNFLHFGSSRVSATEEGREMEETADKLVS